MSTDKKCPYCKGGKITRINTYKSYWYSCNDCGNVIREIKDRYFFEKIIPRRLWGKIPPKQLTLLRPRTIRELLVYALYKNRDFSGCDMYDYYLDPSLGFSESAKGTKWETETDQLLDELKHHNIDISGKTILEISGGPGHVAKNLERIAKKVIVTEFNPTSVSRMRSALGLNAYTFDFNEHNIGELFRDKIDIVLMRHCVNFCLDINKFLKELKPLLNNDVVFYVSTCLPTLGVLCRWSLDDYTFLVLQNPETISRNFAEEGFIQFGQLKQEDYHYLHSRLHRLHLLASPMTIPFFLLNRFKPINTEATVKPRVLFFKRRLSN